MNKSHLLGAARACIACIYKSVSSSIIEKKASQV